LVRDRLGKKVPRWRRAARSRLERFLHLRVIIVHNHYQQAGGEDVVVQDEYGVLANHGHQVRLLEASNDHINGFAARAQTALTAVYSPSSNRRMAAVISEFKPDLVHVHNFFPVFSPSIYYACNDAGVPVVQTLHNYRLICPSSILFRDDHICEDCLSKLFAWPGVLHGCYHGSHLGTAAVAMMTSVHRMLRTYERRVQIVIALTEFARRKLIQGGFPADKLVVKPGFVDVDPGQGQGQGDYVLFVGRLSKEKGVEVLLRAWETLGARVPLRIAGEGPLANYVRQQQEAVPGVEYLGYKSRPEITHLMQQARALIFPSLWYEGLPRTILESFATGTPVIASRLGSMESIVEPLKSGLHFAPGDAADLVRQVDWMLDHPREWQVLRQRTRDVYEAKYSAERNYGMLMEIYERVLKQPRTISLAPLEPTVA
jgi:glycosyltransferase involved in cell wall biosynthesis